MNAIHLKCPRQNGGGLANLSFDKTSGTYRSGSWDISADDAARLVGGWLYLHEAKAVPSQFGGRVLAVEPVAPTQSNAREQVVLIVQPSCAARGQKWRGKRGETAWNSGVIPSSLPHEKDAALVTLPSLQSGSADQVSMLPSSPVAPVT